MQLLFKSCLDAIKETCSRSGRRRKRYLALVVYESDWKFKGRTCSILSRVYSIFSQECKKCRAKIGYHVCQNRKFTSKASLLYFNARS